MDAAAVPALTDMRERRIGRWALVVAATLAALAFLGGAAVARRPVVKAAPAMLGDTGLYSDVAQHRVDPRHLAFMPQYPLWSDGAVKKRWISLPAHAAINGSHPDAWVFPAGTRFWKEFSFGEHRVETRYMELQEDGSWLYATYAWSEDQSEARLVSDKGKPKAFDLGAGRSHDIPGTNDCRSCHQGHASEVLGFSALQLSPARDPNAVHREPIPAPGVDLAYLVANKLLKRLPQALLDTPPAIQAATPVERAALGYLHGNCGYCHNDAGSMRNLRFSLRHGQGPASAGPEAAVATTVGQPLKGRVPGLAPDVSLRVDAGHPERSALLERMRSRNPLVQMPPVGTVIADEEAIRLVAQWIQELEPSAALAGASGKTNQNQKK